MKTEMEEHKQRTEEETQSWAQANFRACLSDIPPEVMRREERLPVELRGLNAKPVVKLARIRQSAETLFSYAGKYAACKEGCAYCCHLNIQISQLEADYIGDKTGIKPVRLLQPKACDPLAFSENTPCPFLKEKTCVIYEYRPLICRIHVNLDKDNYWCRFENWHAVGGLVPQPTFHSIARAFFELNASTKTVIADIRAFFPMSEESSS